MWCFSREAQLLLEELLVPLGDPQPLGEPEARGGPVADPTEAPPAKRRRVSEVAAAIDDQTRELYKALRTFLTLSDAMSVLRVWLMMRAGLSPTDARHPQDVHVLLGAIDDEDARALLGNWLVTLPFRNRPLRTFTPPLRNGLPPQLLDLGRQLSTSEQRVLLDMLAVTGLGIAPDETLPYDVIVNHYRPHRVAHAFAMYMMHRHVTTDCLGVPKVLFDRQGALEHVMLRSHKTFDCRGLSSWSEHTRRGLGGHAIWAPLSRKFGTINDTNRLGPNLVAHITRPTISTTHISLRDSRGGLLHTDHPQVTLLWHPGGDTDVLVVPLPRAVALDESERDLLIIPNAIHMDLSVYNILREVCCREDAELLNMYAWATMRVITCKTTELMQMCARWGRRERPLLVRPEHNPHGLSLNAFQEHAVAELAAIQRTSLPGTLTKIRGQEVHYDLVTHCFTEPFWTPTASLGVLLAQTGTGKTRAALAAALRLGGPTLVLTPRPIRRVWQEEMDTLSRDNPAARTFFEEKVHLASSLFHTNRRGSEDWPRLTYWSYVIVDECHLLFYARAMEVLAASVRANHVILLSASLLKVAQPFRVLGRLMRALQVFEPGSLGSSDESISQVLGRPTGATKTTLMPWGVVTLRNCCVHGKHDGPMPVVDTAIVETAALPASDLQDLRLFCEGALRQPGSRARCVAGLLVRATRGSYVPGVAEVAAPAARAAGGAPVATKFPSTDVAITADQLDDTCPICLEELSTVTNVSAPQQCANPRGHGYHAGCTDCIMMAIQLSRAPKCVMCRVPVRTLFRLHVTQEAQEPAAQVEQAAAPGLAEQAAVAGASDSICGARVAAVLREVVVGPRTIVFTHDDLTWLALGNALRQAGVRHTSRVEEFATDPTLRVVLLTTRDCTGHNLQMAGRVVFAEPPTSVHVYEQAVARAVRQGQRAERVDVRVVCVPGTLDGALYRQVHGKRQDATPAYILKSTRAVLRV